jgi:hypothetical protein
VELSEVSSGGDLAIRFARALQRLVRGDGDERV